MPGDTTRGRRLPSAWRRRRVRVTTLACACALIGVAGVAWQLQGPAAQVLRNGTRSLSDASAVAVDGARVWVTSAPEDDGVPTGPGWVSEFSAGSGGLIRKVSGAGYGFDDPSAVTVSGGRVWVANSPQDTQGPEDTGSLTELDARNGRLIRKVSGAGYGFDDPSAVTVSGGRVWVLNSPQDAAGSVSELDAATGRLIRVIYRGIGTPAAVTSAGGHIWIANACAAGSGGFVTELAAASGRVIRQLAADRYGFACPSGIAADNGRIWVANQAQSPSGGSVTVLSAADGRWVSTLSDGYGFDNPAGIAADGPAVWVADGSMAQTGGSVTELSAADGRHLQTVSSGFSLGAFLDGAWLRSLAGHYQLVNPAVIAAAGTHIWIVSNGTASITILKAG